MALTDLDIRNAKPDAKSYKLFDGAGLYVEIMPSGGKLWRYKYRFGGKEKRLALGAYPVTSLREARDIVVVIDSRGAIPVRAIPFITGGTVNPFKIALFMAHPDRVLEHLNLSTSLFWTTHVKQALFPVDVLQSERNNLAAA